jgi:hypothetical protein
MSEKKNEDAESHTKITARSLPPLLLVHEVEKTPSKQQNHPCPPLRPYITKSFLIQAGGITDS